MASASRAKETDWNPEKEDDEGLTMEAFGTPRTMVLEERYRGRFVSYALDCEMGDAAVTCLAGEAREEVLGSSTQERELTGRLRVEGEAKSGDEWILDAKEEMLVCRSGVETKAPVDMLGDSLAAEVREFVNTAEAGKRVGLAETRGTGVIDGMC